MFPLEEIPPHVLVQILQKMELSTWIRCRLTGEFIFNFVQQNNRQFCFSCPLQIVFVFFGNCQFGVNVRLRKRGWYNTSDVFIKDPETSLAGMRFHRVIIEECFFKNRSQSKSNYKKYLENRDTLFETKVIPVLTVFKRRSEWIRFRTRKCNFGRVAEICKCEKAHFDWDRVKYMTYPSWIEQPGFEGVTHLQIDRMSDFGIVPSLLRRFQYFRGKIMQEDEERGYRQHEVNIITKELMKFSASRTATLEIEKCESIGYIEGSEFQSLPNSRILFEREVIHNFHLTFYRLRNMKMKVVLIKENSFIVLLVIFDFRDDDFSPDLIYHLYAAPSLDPEEVVLFVIEKVLFVNPIDASLLYENLRSEDNIGDVIGDFFHGCHFSNIDNDDYDLF